MSGSQLTRAKKIKRILVSRAVVAEEYNIPELRTASASELARMCHCAPATVVSTMLRYHRALKIDVDEVHINRGAVKYRYEFSTSDRSVEPELPF